MLRHMSSPTIASQSRPFDDQPHKQPPPPASSSRPPPSVAVVDSATNWCRWQNSSGVGTGRAAISSHSVPLLSKWKVPHGPRQCRRETVNSGPSRHDPVKRRIKKLVVLFWSGESSDPRHLSTFLMGKCTVQTEYWRWVMTTIVWQQYYTISIRKYRGKYSTYFVHDLKLNEDNFLSWFLCS